MPWEKVDNITGPPGTTNWSGIDGKPTFAAVATTGDYSDLTGTPAIPSSYSDLSGSVPAGDVSGLDNVATSGSYNDLSDRPTLFSGDYADLTGTPSIPSSYSDLSGSVPWSDVSGAPSIPNSFSDLSGTVDSRQIANDSIGQSELKSDAVSWDDLSGRPSIPSSYSDLSGSVPWSDVSGAPSIPNSFSDLSGTVDSGQIGYHAVGETEIQYDSVGASQIKPDSIGLPQIESGVVPTSYSDLSGTVPWSDVSGAPDISGKVDGLNGAQAIWAGPESQLPGNRDANTVYLFY